MKKLLIYVWHRAVLSLKKNIYFADKNWNIKQLSTNSSNVKKAEVCKFIGFSLAKELNFHKKYLSICKAKKNKIYISGKITGLDFWDAYYNFTNAENDLIPLGVPINPMRLHKRQKGYFAYLIKDIWYLLGCGRVYMLKNWQDSRGARIEYFVAKLFRKEIMYEK